MILKEQHLLELQCQLEALITERDGMIAENKQREHLSQSMAFSYDAFNLISIKIADIGKRICWFSEKPE